MSSATIKTDTDFLHDRYSSTKRVVVTNGFMYIDVLNEYFRLSDITTFNVEKFSHETVSLRFTMRNGQTRSVRITQSRYGEDIEGDIIAAFTHQTPPN